MCIIGVSGVKGSFSEEAALLYAQKRLIHPQLRYLIDMEGVLSALEQGRIELGILPVVNLQGGLVKPALEAMGRHLFRPIDDLWLHVRQCLMVLPSISHDKIKQIVSHPQALAQCRRYLERTFKGVALLEYSDTALAAKDLASGLLSKFTAVIAPKQSATCYGLDILSSNIQDSRKNLTAFIVVGR